MSLSDPGYFLFLALVFLLFYMTRPGAPRRVLLLAASYFFYFELARFSILVLLGVTFVTYYGARLLRSEPATQRGTVMFASVVVVVLIPMLFFKYGLQVATPALQSDFAILAFPIGISFFTFAALGYLIDVYLEVVEPETDFVRVALFLSFFPLVSAGPIERAGRFLPQLDLATKFSAARALSALDLIFVGLVLKLLFAAVLARPANAVFTVPTNYPPITKLVGVTCYAFSLYADFAGYSLIAIGSARLLGLEVRPNFQQPFLSTSVAEYWRNWHISLSSWVRDYLFTPLRMEWRRSSHLGLAAALIISFIILGVWHGATWGYFFFGLMHGILVTASVFTREWRDAFWKKRHWPAPLLHVQRIAITFSLVLIAFVLFRAKSMSDAMIIYQGIFSRELLQNFHQTIAYYCFHRGEELDYRFPQLLACFELIGLLIVGDIFVKNKVTLARLPLFLRVPLYYLGMIIIFYEWLSLHVPAPFQYYKF